MVARELKFMRIDSVLAPFSSQGSSRDAVQDHRCLGEVVLDPGLLSIDTSF